MKKSIYQFSEPRLCKLEFDLCNDFVLRENTECNIQLKLETKIQKKDADEAVVLLQVLLEGDAPYKIIAEESANFKWNMGEVDESDVEKFTAKCSYIIAGLYKTDYIYRYCCFWLWCL